MKSFLIPQLSSQSPVPVEYQKPSSKQRLRTNADFPQSPEEQFRLERKKFYNKHKKPVEFPSPDNPQERASETSPLLSQYRVISEHLSKLIRENNLSLKEQETWQKSLNSMRSCGNSSGQQMAKYCLECGDFHIVDLEHHCSLRTCLAGKCQTRLKNRKIRRFLPFFQQFPVTRGSPKSLFFMTISPKNFQDFQGGYINIKTWFKKFTRTKYIREKIEFGIWVIETRTKNKFGERKGWNIHFHILFFGRRLSNYIQGNCHKCHQHYIKFDRLNQRYYCANHKCGSLDVEHTQNSKIVELFQQCSDGYPVNIDIQEIYSNQKGALEYVLKYIGSNEDNFATPQDFAEYIFHTRKQRLINLFGKELHDFQKHHPGKELFFCKICGNAIQFSSDLEIINMIESYSKLDPPQSERLKFIMEAI